MSGVQLRRDNLQEIRSFAPIGVNGCRGVLLDSQGGWYDDITKGWPGDGQFGLLLPDGSVAAEGDWIVESDGKFHVSHSPETK